MNLTGDLGESGFSPVCTTLSRVLKEIWRRMELRGRLEAECGRELTDREFLKIADLTGLHI